MLFQIVDDILDVTGSEEEMGKQAGADERLGKRTYVSVFGLERARELAAESHAAGAGGARAPAREQLAGDTSDLEHMADFMFSRNGMSCDELQGQTPSVRCWTGSTAPPTSRSWTTTSCSTLAQEVREYIIDTVGEIGGHFGANLGACELAVALHSLLDSPRDKILWDVGHQAYPHKVLTGRRDELPSIRQYGGLAPFCSRGESEHDIMGAGHASTAASYAVGIKEAMRVREKLGPSRPSIRTPASWPSSATAR